MLIDTLSEHDAAKKQYLRELREKIILAIAGQFDHKKMLTFLWNIGITDIDEVKKEVVIWVPNDFILIQIKKLFNKALKEAIQSVYNPQFSLRYAVYTPFSSGKHELLLDLKKFLNITDEQKLPQEQSFALEKTVKAELSQYFWILFDPTYTFDTFVAGANNQFAFSAAKAVAENPGIVYNPLFLYGNVGLGKTHLMQAVGNEIMQKNPDKVVIYLPSSNLIQEIVNALRNNTIPKLLKKFENVDVLLVDDIQFLAWKDRTQEVFHNLFNDFNMKKKQIIISSDRPPKELTLLEERITSRFQKGLVADIQAPDFETRIAILEEKLQRKGLQIDFEYLSLMAQYIKSNVRELEGALNILITRQQLSGLEISEDDVYNCLKTLGYYSDERHKTMENVLQQNKKSTKNFETLVEMVAQYYSLSIEDLKSDSRKKEISTARQLLMLLAKKYFWWTLEKIGEYFWGKNHATAIYAINNMEKKLKSDTELQHDYRVFTDWIE